MRVGVAQAHPPWAGLGFYEEIELAPEWRSFRKEFTAAASDQLTRVHFDLGEQAISVEISLLSLFGKIDGLTNHIGDAGARAGTLTQPSSAATP